MDWLCEWRTWGTFSGWIKRESGRCGWGECSEGRVWWRRWWRTTAGGAGARGRVCGGSGEWPARRRRPPKGTSGTSPSRIRTRSASEGSTCRRSSTTPRSSSSRPPSCSTILSLRCNSSSAPIRPASPGPPTHSTLRPSTPCPDHAAHLPISPTISPPYNCPYLTPYSIPYSAQLLYSHKYHTFDQSYIHKTIFYSPYISYLLLLSILIHYIFILSIQLSIQYTLYIYNQ